MPCSINANCEWVENIEIEYCDGESAEECLTQDECSWDLTYGGYLSFEWYYSCNGYSEIDNSYCQENEMSECSEMNELECSGDDSCDWVEDVDLGSCYDLTPIWDVIYYCDDPLTNSDNCYTYTCYGGGYGQWGTCCGGDPYIIADNSYCEDIPYELGDVNQDSIINIQDVILVINLILNGESDLAADLNLDSTVNVLDVIELINIILN